MSAPAGPPPAPGVPAGWSGRPAWGSPLPPEPAHFSGLCAGALGAAVASALLFVAEGGELAYTPVAAMFTIFLAVAALMTTSDEPLTNRWMAVVALVAGLAPLAHMWLLAAIFTRGLFGT